jgi:hypothetical protein
MAVAIREHGSLAEVLSCSQFPTQCLTVGTVFNEIEDFFRSSVPAAFGSSACPFITRIPVRVPNNARAGHCNILLIYFGCMIASLQPSRLEIRHAQDIADVLAHVPLSAAPARGSSSTSSTSITSLIICRPLLGRFDTRGAITRTFLPAP